MRFSPSGGAAAASFRGPATKAMQRDIIARRTAEVRRRGAEARGSLNFGPLRHDPPSRTNSAPARQVKKIQTAPVCGRARLAGTAGFGEKANAFGYAGGGLGGGCGFFDFGDERGAHDGGIGNAAQGGDVRGKRDAETDGQRKPREAARARDERGQVLGKGFARAGYARARDQVKEAGRAFGDAGEAGVIGSGRGEEYRAEIARAHGGAIFGGFFGREIGGEGAIGAGLRGGGGEFFEAHAQNRIEIAEENQRHLRLRAYATDDFDDACERGAGADGAFAGALDRGAVGHGIAEGHAEFDEAGAGLCGGKGDLHAGIERRIAGGDIGDDAEFAGLREAREGAGDAAFGWALLRRVRMGFGGGFRHSARESPYLCRRGP